MWHHSLPLMNSFNKTEAAVFSCRLCFLRAFPFISLKCTHKIVALIYMSHPKELKNCLSYIYSHVILIIDYALILSTNNIREYKYVDLSNPICSTFAFYRLLICVVHRHTMAEDLYVFVSLICININQWKLSILLKHDTNHRRIPTAESLSCYVGI